MSAMTRLRVFTALSGVIGLAGSLYRIGAQWQWGICAAISGALLYMLLDSYRGACT
jgi:hypothetical protein